MDNAWECQCSDGWFGRDCSVQLELNCNDGRDNDKGKLRTKISLSFFSKTSENLSYLDIYNIIWLKFFSYGYRYTHLCSS